MDWPTGPRGFQPGAFQPCGFQVGRVPTSEVDVYLSRDELRLQVGVPAGHEDRLDRAIVMGTMYVRKVCDGLHELDTPILTPGPLELNVVPTTVGRHQGATIAAVRFWQSASVPFGVAGGLGDLAVRVSGKSIPEADLALQFERLVFGVA